MSSWYRIADDFSTIRSTTTSITVPGVLRTAAAVGAAA
jgi:hypothetical protein